MSTLATAPPPFDPMDLPVAWSAIGAGVLS